MNPAASVRVVSVNLSRDAPPATKSVARGSQSPAASLPSLPSAGDSRARRAPQTRAAVGEACYGARGEGGGDGGGIDAGCWLKGCGNSTPRGGRRNGIDLGGEDIILRRAQAVPAFRFGVRGSVRMGGSSWRCRRTAPILLMGRGSPAALATATGSTSGVLSYRCRADSPIRRV